MNNEVQMIPIEMIAPSEDCRSRVLLSHRAIFLTARKVMAICLVRLHGRWAMQRGIRLGRLTMSWRVCMFTAQAA